MSNTDVIICYNKVQLEQPRPEINTPSPNINIYNPKINIIEGGEEEDRVPEDFYMDDDDVIRNTSGDDGMLSHTIILEKQKMFVLLPNFP